MTRSRTLAGLACVLGCLPPATIETPVEPALIPAAAGELAARECRALITERGDRGPRTHELRWDSAELEPITAQPGLVVGTADELFALRVERVPVDPTSLYGEAGRGLSCEQDLISARRLPEGVSQPLAEALPACVGEFEGERVEVASSLRLLSAMGPLLAWRTQTEGFEPGPIGLLRHLSLDLRTAELARAEDWLPGPSQTMALAEPERSTCELRDAPRELAELRGFALVWDAVARVRVRVGYSCCSWAHNRSMCELDDPLPA
ncbi:hypothetical protein, partial [Enhygromyxa salina]|uniref:hypothetical protein n=1 Tax=Enhygromyxa salina TaxID=215803 RepID=UPI0011B21785